MPRIRVEARLDNHFPFESAHFFDGGFERYRNIIGVVQLTVDIVHDGYWLGDVFQQKAVHSFVFVSVSTPDGVESSLENRTVKRFGKIISIEPDQRLTGFEEVVSDGEPETFPYLADFCLFIGRQGLSGTLPDVSVGLGCRLSGHAYVQGIYAIFEYFSYSHSAILSFLRIS